MNTWVSWAGGSAYANEQLSAEIHRLVNAETVFDQFCDEPEFGAGQGESLYYRLMNAGISPGPVTLAANTLGEGAPIPLDTWTHLRALVTVGEIGRGVSWSKKLDVLSKWNINAETKRLLKEHLAQVVDGAAAAQFLLTDAVYQPTGAAAGSFVLTGTPVAAAGSNLNVYHLNRLYDYMGGTLRIPKLNGDYVAIVNTFALRGLKNDATFERVQLYAEPQKRLNNEVGRAYGFRFVETNNTTSLPNIAAVCGGGVFFGADAVQKITAAAPVILFENTGDFGRTNRLAWWGLVGWGITWRYTLHTGARIVRLGST